MQIIMASRTGTLTLNLLYLCLLHGKAKCKNELDKVNGLWALALDCCQQAVPVGHSSTIEEVL
jgi:hypothetical protein